MSPKNIYINIMGHGLAALVAADPSDAVQYRRPLGFTKSSNLFEQC